MPHTATTPENRLRAALHQRDLADVLENADWPELAARARLQDVAAAETLYREGEELSALPFLLSGEVKLTKAGPQGREYVLHLLRPGAFCDVAALYYTGGVPTSAVMVTSGRVLWLEKSALLRCLSRNPALAAYLLGVLSHRQRLFINKIVSSQGVISVSRRVAAWLLHRSRMEKSATLHLSGTRELLARLLGVSRESLSRELNGLARAGVIRLERSHIEILQRETLERSAHD